MMASAGAISACGPGMAGDPPEAPGPPDSTVADPGGEGEIEVTWTAPITGGVVDNYRLEYNIAGGGWNLWASYGMATFADTITGLANSVSVAVRVIASNEVGDGTSTGDTDYTLPGVILDLSLTPGSLSVVLAWTNPSGLFTHIEFQRSDNGGSSWSPVGTTASPPVNDTGLSEIPYHYRFRSHWTSSGYNSAWVSDGPVTPDP